MKSPIRVPPWHRKAKTDFAVRSSLPFFAALGVVMLWFNKVVYDLDGTTLTVRKEVFCGLHIRNEERVLASDILEYKVETDKKWFGLYGRKALAVLCKDGKFLMHYLGKGADRFHDGLTQALQKQPVGTFYGEHWDVPVAEIAFLIMMFVAAWYDTRRRK